MEVSKRDKIIGILMVLSTALFWSTAGILIKLMPWNPLVIGGWRGLAAALMIFAYMKLKRMPIVINRHSLLVGAAVAVTNLLFLAANKLTTAANAIVLQYTNPIFIVLFSALIFKKRFKRADYFAVLITVLGIALFFLDELTPGGMIGNILAIADGACLAFMYILTGESDEATRLSGIMTGAVMAFIVGAPFTAVFETPVSAQIILTIIAMGLLQLALPYIIYSAALKRCPPLACSLIGSIEIVLNPVWVLLLVGEKPGMWALIGGAVILVTITVWCALDVAKANKAPHAADAPPTQAQQ